MIKCSKCGNDIDTGGNRYLCSSCRYKQFDNLMNEGSRQRERSWLERLMYLEQKIYELEQTVIDNKYEIEKLKNNE